MDIVIVAIGLLLTVIGAYLAWHNKGAGVWATFAFGFLLVVVGGPVSSRLGSLSISGTGVEVAFNTTTISAAEEGALTKRVTEALLSLSPKKGEGDNAQQVLLGTASRSFHRDLLNSITSAGFIPIQPTGAELLKPGTVLRLEEGQPVVWATSSEAFPGIQITESSVALPNFDFRKEEREASIAVSFECRQGSTVSEVSLHALSTSLSPNIVKILKDSIDLRVIQSILVCKGLGISAKIETISNTDADDLRYDDDSSIVLGLRLAALSP